MKRFLKWLLVACISLALVWPIWPILYALLGGGFIGGAAVIILGWTTNWAVSTVVDNTIAGYRWARDRREATELRSPEPTAYENEWTKITKGDRI